MWTRCYGAPNPNGDAMEELSEVLGKLNARRMVVGHTPQLRGINAAAAEDGCEVCAVSSSCVPRAVCV